VLVWAINTMGLKVKFKWPFVISNSVLWLMFVVLITLFVTLPTKMSNNCNGRRPTEQDQTTQEVVKIIFFITLMVIASLLLLGLFIFGKFIFRAFEKSNTLLKVNGTFVLFLIYSSVLFSSCLHPAKVESFLRSSPWPS
jgi:ABC-type Na+ efflux pump permease subunit